MERSKPCVLILIKRMPNASKMIAKLFILKNYRLFIQQVNRQPVLKKLNYIQLGTRLGIFPP